MKHLRRNFKARTKIWIFTALFSALPSGSMESAAGYHSSSLYTEAGEVSEQFLAIKQTSREGERLCKVLAVRPKPFCFQAIEEKSAYYLQLLGALYNKALHVHGLPPVADAPLETWAHQQKAYLTYATYAKALAEHFLNPFSIAPKVSAYDPALQEWMKSFDAFAQEQKALQAMLEDECVTREKRESSKDSSGLAQVPSQALMVISTFLDKKSVGNLRVTSTHTYQKIKRIQENHEDLLYLLLFKAAYSSAPFSTFEEVYAYGKEFGSPLAEDFTKLESRWIPALAWGSLVKSFLHYAWCMKRLGELESVTCNPFWLSPLECQRILSFRKNPFLAIPTSSKLFLSEDMKGFSYAGIALFELAYGILCSHQLFHELKVVLLAHTVLKAAPPTPSPQGIEEILRHLNQNIAVHRKHLCSIEGGNFLTIAHFAYAMDWVHHYFHAYPLKDKLFHYPNLEKSLAVFFEECKDVDAEFDKETDADDTDGPLRHLYLNPFREYPILKHAYATLYAGKPLQDFIPDL